MMRYPLGTTFSLALLTSVTVTSVQAQDLTSDEIYRRFQIQQETGLQQQGGATRGLSLNYGAPRTVPEQAVDSERGLALYQGDMTPVAPETSGIVMESAGDVAPIRYTDDVYEATDLTPSGPLPTTVIPGQTYQTYETVTLPDPVALQTYQPVQDEARVDLRVYFEWNSASLKPEAIGQLAELCSAINRVVGQRVFKIIGHTDKSGSDEYNLYLSEARAREVKRHLVESCGIPRGSLIAVGEGERQANPDAPLRDPSERRVEVQLVG